MIHDNVRLKERERGIVNRKVEWGEEEEEEMIHLGS